MAEQQGTPSLDPYQYLSDEELLQISQAGDVSAIPDDLLMKFSGIENAINKQQGLSSEIGYSTVAAAKQKFEDTLSLNPFKQFSPQNQINRVSAILEALPYVKSEDFDEAAGDIGRMVGGFIGGAGGGTAGAIVGTPLAPVTGGASIPAAAATLGSIGTVEGGDLGEAGLKNIWRAITGRETDFSKDWKQARTDNSLMESPVEYGLGAVSTIGQGIRGLANRASKLQASELGTAVDDLARIKAGEVSPLQSKLSTVSTGKSVKLGEKLASKTREEGVNLAQKIVDSIDNLDESTKTWEQVAKQAETLASNASKARVGLVSGLGDDIVISTDDIVASFGGNPAVAIDEAISSIGEGGEAIRSTLVKVRKILPVEDPAYYRPFAPERRIPTFTPREALQTVQDLNMYIYGQSKAGLSDTAKASLANVRDAIEDSLLSTISKVDPELVPTFLSLTDDIAAGKTLGNAAKLKSAKSNLGQSSVEGKVVKEEAPQDILQTMYGFAKDIISRGKQAIFAPTKSGGKVPVDAKQVLMDQEAAQVQGLLNLSRAKNNPPAPLQSILPSALEGVGLAGADMAQSGAEVIPSAIDSALGLGIEPNIITPEIPLPEMGDPLLEGVDTNQFYQSQINIPDSNTRFEDAVNKAIDEGNQPQKIARNSTAVMQFLADQDIESLGLDPQDKEEIAALMSATEEDQRRGAMLLARAKPELFESPEIPGFSSMVDGVIIDPEEKIRAEQMLDKKLMSDPIKKAKAIKALREDSPLPTFSYKFLGGQPKRELEDEFLAQSEGFRTKAYLDTAKNGVRVTVGEGVNLSDTSINQLRDIGIPEDLITKVAPYIGKRGEAARQALRNNPLELSEEEAMSLSKAFKQDTIDKLNAAYKSETGVELKDIPAPARTVLISLGYNIGANLKSATPKIWRAALSGRWDVVADRLENPRNWTANPDLMPRRLKEAKLLRDMIGDSKVQMASLSNDLAVKGQETLADGTDRLTYKF